MDTEQLRKWMAVEIELPKEGGRYWCYIEEINDLGTSYYQWNCSYNQLEQRWGDDNGGRVTHWTTLLDPPNGLERLSN